MICFPNCKINIGLNVISKRSDGFHNLETVFYPVYQLYDALEIISIPPSQVIDATAQFTFSGLPIAGDSFHNLCAKAYRLIKNDFPTLPLIQMHLHKVIPMGAGLGGGSADGAFALQLLNEKFHLNLTSQALATYALQLGSDAPFFVHNKPCFAKGRGNELEAVQINLSGYIMLLIYPNIHVNTGWAFGKIVPTASEGSLQTCIHLPIESWKEKIKNDFELPVINAYPVIGEIKQQLYDMGAIYASLSGSGSVVYGIFSPTKAFPKQLFPDLYTAIVQL